MSRMNGILLGIESAHKKWKKFAEIVGLFTEEKVADIYSSARQQADAILLLSWNTEIMVC